MKKALVYISHNDYMAIEEAMVRFYDGYEVFFLVCDNSIGICHPNPYDCKTMCKFCSYSMMKHIAPLLKKDSKFHYISMRELITEDDNSEALGFKFSYSTVEELKGTVFHGVEIGYGAFSTYVSCSRNVMPNFTRELCNYLNQMMQAQIKMTLALERYIDVLKPDLIVLHNGRFLNFKPFLCLAKNRGIDFVATETRMVNNTMVVNNFFNDIPHSFNAIQHKIELAWSQCGEDKGTVIGKSFFENRRNAKPAGDKIYIKDQIQGKLPPDFDPNKRNIAIFNSSEDEFFSISKDYDRAVLFPNQYLALKSIFEHYKNDCSVHFYLRIHPNLAVVPYRSHVLLYQLLYSNVTILPPNSDISSYALMDASEKVIVFNSTMGLESSYWGKPVIALNKSFYTGYNLCYQPQTPKELFELIDDQNLLCKKDEVSCYKIACYCMGFGLEEFKYYKNQVIFWHGFVYPWNKLLGSCKLYHLIEIFICKYAQYIGGGGEYKDYKRTRNLIDAV